MFEGIRWTTIHNQCTNLIYLFKHIFIMYKKIVIPPLPDDFYWITLRVFYSKVVDSFKVRDRLLLIF